MITTPLNFKLNRTAALAEWRQLLSASCTIIIAKGKGCSFALSQT